MKTILLVDLSGLWRQNWHASEDQELGAAYTKTVGTVQSLVSRYSHAAICLDMPPYNRKKLYSEYKAQREAPTTQMVEQFRRVKERLIADGLLLWGAHGYEADDIIATAVKLAPRDGDTEIFIASSDKDLLQLVDGDNRPGGARSALPVFAMSFRDLNVLIDTPAVIAKFGVPPVLMGDLLALMGDTSDNIPGIEKVGPKTGAALLKQFGSFEDVLDKATEIKTLALRENVLKGAAVARTTRKLVELATDAPIQFSDLFDRREPKPLTTSISSAGFEDADFEPAPKSDPEASKSPSEPSPPASQGQASQSAGPGVASAAPRSPASTALAVRPEPPKEWALQLEPIDSSGAWKLAGLLHNSRLFTSFGTAEAILAVILRGRSLGIDAVTSLANFHVIEGKTVMHAALVVGLVLRSGKAEHFELIKTTDEEAIWVTRRKGSTREVEMSWSVKDALNAGLLVGTPENACGVSKSGKPSNWDKYRRTMLRWRAAVELARAVYPDITTGIYTPDEITDGVYDPAIEAKFEAA